VDRRGLKAYEHKRSLARWGRNGCDSVLYMGRKVCQPCTLVQCEGRGQGNVCELCEHIVRETGGWKGTVVWGSDNDPCPVNTDCRNDADSICYMCAGMYGLYLNKNVLVIKRNPSWCQ